MNPNPGIAAVPLQTVAPTEKLAQKWEKKFKRKTSATKKPQAKTKFGANVDREDPNLAYEEARIDISGVPPPFCSCSGVARRCYKCGPGGWQSSCCTNALSQYPLPLSPSKPGKRISGRKMGGRPYKKLLCKLYAEGCDLSQPVDLKNHWAKLGSNKFFTIK